VGVSKVGRSYSVSDYRGGKWESLDVISPIGREDSRAETGTLQ